MQKMLEKCNIGEMSELCILSPRLLLRPLQISDISEAYLHWLNDPEVTKYLEIRHVPQTFERVCDYLQKRLDMPESPHLGIFDCAGTRHIGTITLNHLHRTYGSVDISFVIGHPDARGKGYATEGVHAVLDWIFNVRGLYKVTGGHYASNIGSLRVFQKNGFSQEGFRREQVVTVDGLREDVVLHGLLRHDFMRKTF